jgi:hypothetical protein
MRIHGSFILSLVFVGCVFSSPLSVRAADHRNLEENHPTRIEDAYPIAYRSFEFQTRGGYERNGEFGKDIGRAELELKWGALKNTHFVLGLPLQFGNEVEPDQNGDVVLEGLYNFNVETQFLPAMSLKTEFSLPGGSDSNGVGFELMGIATKGWGNNRFHLNAGYHRNSGASQGERTHLYRLGLAFDRPINLDHLFVSDFFIDQSELKGDEPVYSFLVGIRKQINPWSVLNLGVGHGFGSQEAPDLIFTLGFQINF